MLVVELRQPVFERVRVRASVSVGKRESMMKR